MHFRMLAPLIRFERQCHPGRSLLDAATAAIKHAGWPAPATVVAALAAKSGLEK
jgi:hypothetical protein